MSACGHGQRRLVGNAEQPPLSRALPQARSHGSGEARLYDDARSDAVPLHGHGVEVEGSVHRPGVVAGSYEDVCRQLVAIEAAADFEAALLRDARAGVEEPRRADLSQPGYLVDPTRRSPGLGPISRRGSPARSSFDPWGCLSASSTSPSTIVAWQPIPPAMFATFLVTGRVSVASISHDQVATLAGCSAHPTLVLTLAYCVLRSALG